MIKSIALNKIAEINTGYAFRQAVGDSSTGKTVVLQTKDLESNAFITESNTFAKTSLEIPRSKSFLQPDDVLLSSRGSGTHKSTVFKVANNNVIASASLFIIRIRDNAVLPEYLSLYLNSREGQEALSQITTGAYIQNIPKKNLEQIPIPIPTIPQQRNLVALQQNIWQQKKITEQKNQLKQEIINATLINIIKRQVK